MAVQEQVERLTRSIEEWNQWRLQYPLLEPDLSGAFLYEAKFSRADLSKANLNGINLSYADLRGADFSDAKLSDADLRYANLSRTDFRRTDLSRANLMEANLSGAKLSGAKLSRADLMYTNLCHANFSHANLSRTDLSRADLYETDLSHTRMWGTILGELDLRPVKGLEMVVHMGPSHLSINTLYLSHGDIPKAFVKGTGAPDSFIESMYSLVTTPIQYHSLFLSHSHHDQAFAKRLHSDLQNQGVRCWLALHDLRPGTPMVRGIEEAIHVHEKLLLILSHHAVISNWVQHEVEAALYKQVTSGQETLFPIRLDNAILESDTQWAKRLRKYHIGDFTGWQDDAAYQLAFTTLLRHLKVDRPSTV